MRIKIRHKSGVDTIDIADNSTISDLLTAIESKFKEKITEIKSGFPPRAVILSNTQQSLSSLGIRNGDQVIVASSGVSSPSITSTSVATSSSSSRGPSSQSSSASSHDAISVSGGYVVMREMKDDNSCLFRSIAYVLERNVNAYPKLRQIVADDIKADPVSYPDVVLGFPRDKYISTILSPNSWGGAIELAVLSKHYRTEICSVDVATSRIDQFGQGEYENRVVVIYSGIHYDALALTPDLAAPLDFDTTVFKVDDDTLFILHAATQLTARLKARHYYTDTATFSLKCLECGTGLMGEKEAKAHAEKTSHVRFGEYE